MVGLLLQPVVGQDKATWQTTLEETSFQTAISGIPRSVRANITRHNGSQHGAAISCQVLIYFWDSRHGADQSGWWFGPEIGGEKVREVETHGCNWKPRQRKSLEKPTGSMVLFGTGCITLCHHKLQKHVWWSYFGCTPPFGPYCSCLALKRCDVAGCLRWIS